jgi:serine/threonine-protein kinase
VVDLNRELWNHADRLLDEALDLPHGERRAFLDRECGDNAELRDLVERLLSNLETRSGFLAPGGALESPVLEELDEPGEEPAEPAPSAVAGREVDRYRLVQELGRGGMAIVYLAERADGQFEHQVALKLIKRGIDTDEVVRRFARERQIMARASHPNVARLLDGGATEDGQPYFVMEYVEGQPIDRYCDERRLTIRERLELFLQVADAVAYAHRNLVVHRDIKPSNILVTKSGDVKLLDFGIAKLLDDSDEEGALTRTGLILMTPAFASPEQVRGDPVTTATDIYQLGLLMYLLLTGRSPYRARGDSSQKLQKAILEIPPARASAVVADPDAADPTGEVTSIDDISANRRTTAAQLRRELTDDLDNIALVALRKEADRRYPTASQLIDDVRRFLTGRPVSARPDTLAYRTSKFVRRHRVVVALGMTALWLLVAFSVTMALQASRIAEERDRANREAATAEQVSEFLIDLFEVADPDTAEGSTVTARELLDRGADRVSAELSNEPEVQAALQDTIGRVYQKLSLYESAEPLLQQALDTRSEVLGPDHEDIAASLSHVGWLHQQRGDYETAAPLVARALEMRRRIYGDRHLLVAEALNDLALLQYHSGEFDAAEASFREALAMRRSLLETGDTALADVLGNFALLQQRRGELDEAEAMQREALEIRRAVLGDVHAHVAISLDGIATILTERQEFDGAEALIREALEMRRSLFGERHHEVSDSLNNLASVLYFKGDLDGAERTFRELIEVDREILGESHPDYGRVVNNLGSVLHRKGEPEAAVPVFREALEIFERGLDPDHFQFALTRSNLGACLTDVGRFDEAERNLLQAYPAMQKALGDDHAQARRVAARLADLYEAWGRPEQAASYRAIAEAGDSE